MLSVTKHTRTPKRPVISLLYHPSTNRVRKIIQSNWSLLQSRAELAAIFSQPPLIAYKRDTNIRDMLVRSKLHQPATRTPWTTPCNQAKCGTCPFICTSTIHCTKCAQLYIGETGRTLDTASKNTLGTLNTGEKKPVANHFNQTGHTIHNFRVKGLWFLFTDSVNDRKDMESHLTDKLGSRKPGGMNEKL